MLAEPFEINREKFQLVVDASVKTGIRSWSPWSFWFSAIGVGEARRMVTDAGIEVPVLEALSQWSGGPSEQQQQELDQLLELADTFGASMLMACVLEPAADLSAAADGLALACDAAAAQGLRVCLEFLPWTAVPTLQTGWELIQRSGASNSGLILDAWHWHRQPGGRDVDLLRSIPGERIHYVQLCDAGPTPGPDPMAECMSSRLPTGEGVVDFAEFLDAIDATGATPLVTTEVFNTALAARGPQAHAEAVRAALGTILED
jgi:sugar phosphate isomerase/epimerase